MVRKTLTIRPKVFPFIWDFPIFPVIQVGFFSEILDWEVLNSFKRYSSNNNKHQEEIIIGSFA